MKSISALLMFAASLTLTSPQAQAVDSEIKLKAPTFTILKCFGGRLGTLWASFGHAMTSDSDKVTTFPSEIVFFDADKTVARKFYSSITEALQIPVIAERTRIRLEFPTTHDNGVIKTHVLTLMLLDLRDPNTFVGNWQISTPGQPDRSDLANCSVY